MEVGVRELKQHLSEYLDRAARGDVVTVTERGRPKALIVPLPGADPLAHGIAEGWITAPSRAARLGPSKRARADSSTADVLSGDRGD